MKKLMIAAAIVCAAAFANAAAITWSTGKLYMVDADGKWDTTTTAYAGGADLAITAYLYDSTGDTLLGSKSVGSPTSKASAWSNQSFMNGSTVVTVDNNASYMVKLVMTGDFGNGDTQTFTATDLYSITTPENGAATVSFGANPKVIDTTKTQWSAVPEPTSGLLLLLGMAGLALRRRRA